MLARTQILATRFKKSAFAPEVASMCDRVAVMKLTRGHTDHREKAPYPGLTAGCLAVLL
jgi:hypothetical protein